MRALSSKQPRELRRGGLSVDADPGAYRRVIALSRAQERDLLEDGLTAAEAASVLNASEADIERRLGERRLLGGRLVGSWRLPRLQFGTNGLVPGVDTVISSAPADLPLLALANWLTSSNPDLEVGERAISPLEWLSAGHDVQTAARLASEL
jgi:hypothetical protein